MLYTLDKIVLQGLKHLQAMANDENVSKLVGLFVYHHNRDFTAASKAASRVSSERWAAFHSNIDCLFLLFNSAFKYSVNIYCYCSYFWSLQATLKVL